MSDSAILHLPRIIVDENGVYGDQSMAVRPIAQITSTLWTGRLRANHLRACFQAPNTSLRL